MIYIKGLKFRGFKSFKKVDVTFPKGYVCLTGPNGSGKSNITDGIRFALGESSLKSLRAKKVSDLINHGSNFVEVVLYLGGDKNYEIKRAINSEGKTLYRLNGRRSTRINVLEELRQNGLEIGSHNIIAQGQVQRIIEMNPKERRQIIDQVAGISEFDAKKEEAIKELEKVEQKITEAKIVLGEREAILNDLEKEKNDALAFLAAKENFAKAQASIANMEYSKLNKTHTDLISRLSEISNLKSNLSKQIDLLNSRISELNLEKQKIVSQIGSAESKDSTVKEIEEVKIKISSENATLNAKAKEISSFESYYQKLSADISDLQHQESKIKKEIEEIQNELKLIEKQIEKLKKEKPQIVSLSSDLEILSQKIMSLKERKASVEISIQNLVKVIENREKEKKQLAQTIEQSQIINYQKEKDAIIKEISSLERKSEEIFQKEKEINRILPEVDKKLLSVKEKAATIKANISVSSNSKIIEEISKFAGVFGTISSLISCDAKYNFAVEACAGQRLNYVVVDKLDTAIKAIQWLKEKKLGRITFIPLDTIKTPEVPSKDNVVGCLGNILDFIEFEEKYKKAIYYVFGDCLLFDNIQNAKKAQIGKYRIVTLDGELIEKSGLISGGFQKSSGVLSLSLLEKIEKEAQKIKEERESYYASLYSIREELNNLRREKASLEIKLKSIEIEEKTNQERIEKDKKTIQIINEIEQNISNLKNELEKLKQEQSSLNSELSLILSEYEKAKKSQNELSEKLKKEAEELQKQILELTSKESSLKERLSLKFEEQKKISFEISKKKTELKEIETNINSCKNEMIKLQASIEKLILIQKEKEERLKELSSASQSLLKKLQDLESQIESISSQLGKLKLEDDKLSKEIMELEIKRQTTQTKLADLKATLEQYQGVPIIEASRQELEELANKSRAAMESLGNVNLRAPQLYEEKKKDIEEIKQRVASLDSEKKAVFSIIEEIESKKKAIFLSTFTAVNENFKKLLGHVFKGEGTLVLEKPSDIFDSGLLIKIKDKNHEKYLDSMSGGEKSILALIFIFSLQMYKAAPFYILDEADAALDKENSMKFSQLLKQLSKDTQFLVVSHNDTVLSNADVVLGVTRTDEGSKIVGVQLTANTNRPSHPA